MKITQCDLCKKVGKERSQWLVLRDEGWNIIIPESDVKPHSTEKKGEKLALAYSDCPCKPKVSYETQSIIHNSFAEKLELEISIKRNMGEPYL